MKYSFRETIIEPKILGILSKYGLGLSMIRLTKVFSEGNLYIEIKILKKLNDFGKEALNKAISELRTEGYSVRLRE